MMRWFMLGCLLVIVSCSAHKQQMNPNPNIEESPIEKLANEKFDGNYFIVNNESNTYSLVKSKTKKFSEIGYDITYLIFNNQTNELILEGFLKSGYIDWIDEYTVKVVNRKLVEDYKRQKEAFLYNVRTKERKVIDER